jgi:energy-coupling factor transport system substrate-specific component
MAASGSAEGTPGLRYTTVELVIIAIVAVVMGVVNTLFGTIYTAVAAAGGPIWPQVINPFGMVVTIAMLIVRKPGAALLAGILNGLIQFLTGNPAGLWSLAFGAGHGIGVEIWYAIFQYKKFGWGPVFVASAFGDALISNVLVLFAFGYTGLSVPMYVVSFVAAIIFYGLESGLLGKLVVDGLYAAGLLEGFRIAKFKEAGEP